MKSKLLGVILLIMSFGAFGCNPPVPCLEGNDFIALLVGDLVDCTGLGMVCNEAVSISDACDDFMSFFTDIASLFGDQANDLIPDVCSLLGDNDPFGLMDYVGSCQLLGGEGDPCAEAADCESEVCTAGGVCGALAE